LSTDNQLHLTVRQYHDQVMSTVTEIERAVEQLPAEELAHFRAWFAEFDAARWDRQFEQDVDAGRLNALAEEAITELSQGHCTDL
jgi:hypothetical protein